MEKINGTKLSRGLSYVVAGMLALLPFHAFLTVWVSSGLGHYTVLRLWKEIVLVGVMVPVWYILWHNKNIRHAVLHSRLIRAVCLFILLQLVAGIVALAVGYVNWYALGYALITNTRYLVFFLVTLVLARECTWLHWHWRNILLIPSILVVAFGLLQFFVLPSDALERFGYGPDTIPAVSTIDGKVDFVRVQSTLRGANPLGAYLVIVVSAVVALIIKHKHYREWRIAGAAAVLLLLFLTSSRSAWIGAFLSLACIVWLWLQRIGKHSRLLVLSSVLVVVLAILGVLVFRDNDYVQNYVFHTNERSPSSVSSNEARANALLEGARDVANHPWGQGPGTAGPASVYNDHPARISENYLLQIGQEVGWLGGILYLLIMIAVARHLWFTRNQTLSVMLLASLIGLTAVNLLSHAWSDDTLSYLWWGLAGIAVAPSVLGDRKHEIREASAT